MVALLAQKAEVNYDKTLTSVVEIVKHITDLGFQTSVIEDNAQGFSVVELAVCPPHCWFHLSHLVGSGKLQKQI